MSFRSIRGFREFRGFTIIEVLIAMALLSFVMIYSITTIDQSSQTKERVIEEDREIIQVEAALERLDSDFSQIYSPLYLHITKKEEQTLFPPSRNEEQRESEAQPEETSLNFPERTNLGGLIPLVEDPEDSTLTFMSTANRRKIEEDKQSHYAWIRYSLRPASEENGQQSNKDSPLYEFVRQFNADNPYQPEHDWDQIKKQVLLQNVSSLKFFFWSPKKEKFVESLNRLERNKNLLRGVKIELSWVDKNGISETKKRILRPLWPSFDVLAEQKKISKEYKRKLQELKNRRSRQNRQNELKRQQRQNPRNNPNNPNNPSNPEQEP